MSKAIQYILVGLLAWFGVFTPLMLIVIAAVTGCKIGSPTWSECLDQGAVLTAREQAVRSSGIDSFIFIVFGAALIVLACNIIVYFRPENQ